MASAYESGAKFVSVPILRNVYTVKKHHMNNGVKKILFILSYFHDAALHQIKYANIIAKEFGNKIQIILKNHPVNIDDKVEDIINEPLYFKPYYVTGKLSDYLENIDVAVVHSESTTSLEVLCASVQLIVMIKAGEITSPCVPVELNPDAYRIVYTSEQMVTRVSDILAMSGIQYNADMDDFFETKNTENIAKMFL